MDIFFTFSTLHDIYIMLDIVGNVVQEYIFVDSFLYSCKVFTNQFDCLWVVINFVFKRYNFDKTKLLKILKFEIAVWYSRPFAITIGLLSFDPISFLLKPDRKFLFDCIFNVVFVSFI